MPGSSSIYGLVEEKFKWLLPERTKKLTLLAIDINKLNFLDIAINLNKLLPIDILKV